MSRGLETSLAETWLRRVIYSQNTLQVFCEMFYKTGEMGMQGGGETGCMGKGLSRISKEMLYALQTKL